MGAQRGGCPRVVIPITDFVAAIVLRPTGQVTGFKVTVGEHALPLYRLGRPEEKGSGQGKDSCDEKSDGSLQARFLSRGRIASLPSIWENFWEKLGLTFGLTVVMHGSAISFHPEISHPDLDDGSSCSDLL